MMNQLMIGEMVAIAEKRVKGGNRVVAAKRSTKKR